MSTIFCDNDGCMFSDGCGFCDCDKLSIVDGVCEGSVHSGRNASDGDIDERLKAENAKLQERVEWLDGECRKRMGESHKFFEMVGEYQKENAKLRELVCDMFEEIEAGGFDPMVERHGKSTVYYEEDPSWRVGIRERVRELGIEVK